MNDTPMTTATADGTTHALCASCARYVRAEWAATFATIRVSPDTACDRCGSAVGDVLRDHGSNGRARAGKHFSDGTPADMYDPTSWP